MEALIGHGNIERLRHRRFLEVRMIALWRLGSWLMVRRRRLPVRNRFRVSDRDDNLPDGGTAGEPCQGVPAFGQCINPVDARPTAPLLPPAEQLRYVLAMRSEARRVGKEGGRRCRYRWSPHH